MENDIFDYIYFGDVNKKLGEIANLSPETWSFKGKNDYRILSNYLQYTFKKAVDERKFIEASSYAVFNTGLFTDMYEPIYLYMEPNKNTNAQKWFLKNIGTDYDMGAMAIGTLPKRVDYFSDPSLLVFDVNYEIRLQYKHILQDENNLKRIPESIRESPNLQQIFIGAVDIMKKKVAANYKIAVPQYYNGKIQLLLPLCLVDGTNPDLALAVSKSNNGTFYQGHTCLTMDMAYINARLITKPESNWLHP